MARNEKPRFFEKRLILSLPLPAENLTECGQGRQRKQEYRKQKAFLKRYARQDKLMNIRHDRC